VTTDNRETSKFVRCSNCSDFVEVPDGFKRFIEAKNILSADPIGLKKLQMHSSLGFKQNPISFDYVGCCCSGQIRVNNNNQNSRFSLEVVVLFWN
jgi:hypothetical protein